MPAKENARSLTREDQFELSTGKDLLKTQKRRMLKNGFKNLDAKTMESDTGTADLLVERMQISLGNSWFKVLQSK